MSNSKSINSKFSEKEFMLKGNLWKVMVKLSWPAVIAMVLYGFNGVIDAIFVGRFVGEVALAGVSIAYPLSQITLGIGSLLGVGVGSALSIALGANDKKIEGKLIPNMNYLTIIITIVYMILGLIFAEYLVRIMGGSGEALDFGTNYFRITIYGAVFWIYGLAYNMVVRAEGKMKTAAVIMGVGLGANIIANYVLMGLLNMGVEGAAWGTNFGMFIYTVAGLIYFKKGKVTFKANPLKIEKDKKITKDIISMGMSSLIMSVMTLIQAVVVMNALARYGTTQDVAFYGASYRIFTFLLTPIFGLMRALQPVIGINFGAKKYDRVIKSFNIFAIASTILMAPFWLACMISPDFVLGLMIKDIALTATEALNFRVLMAVLPILPLIFMAMTFFPAINKGKMAAMFGIIRQVVLYIPVMLILPKIFGTQAVYYGSTIIDIIVTLFVFILVVKEFKMLKNLELVK